MIRYLRNAWRGCITIVFWSEAVVRKLTLKGIVDRFANHNPLPPEKSLISAAD